MPAARGAALGPCTGGQSIRVAPALIKRLLYFMLMEHEASSYRFYLIVASALQGRASQADQASGTAENDI